MTWILLSYLHRGIAPEVDYFGTPYLHIPPWCTVLLHWGFFPIISPLPIPPHPHTLSQGWDLLRPYVFHFSGKYFSQYSENHRHWPCPERHEICLIRQPLLQTLEMQRCRSSSPSHLCKVSDGMSHRGLSVKPLKMEISRSTLWWIRYLK